MYSTETFHARLTEDGRVVIPAPLRRELGLAPGSEVVIERAGDAVQVRPFDHVLRQAQNFFRQFAQPGQSVVDDLIAERRAEATRDEAELADWIAGHGPAGRA